MHYKVFTTSYILCSIRFYFIKPFIFLLYNYKQIFPDLPPNLSSHVYYTRSKHERHYSFTLWIDVLSTIFWAMVVIHTCTYTQKRTCAEYSLLLLIRVALAYIKEIMNNLFTIRWAFSKVVRTKRKNISWLNDEYYIVSELGSYKNTCFKCMNLEIVDNIIFWLQLRFVMDCSSNWFLGNFQRTNEDPIWIINMITNHNRFLSDENRIKI